MNNEDLIDMAQRIRRVVSEDMKFSTKTLALAMSLEKEILREIKAAS